MNNNDVQTLQSLKDLNASIKEFNKLLVDLNNARQTDKLNWLKGMNNEIKQFNTLLTHLLGSRRKDAITQKLSQ